MSPLSSVDSVLQNGSIITHPPSNETISSLGDNEAVDATYSLEGSSGSNVSPRNYNLRPKTPPTPGHLLVVFRASQQPSEASSPSPSPQEQQEQQMGSPVNIPMAVRPIPIQVQRGQFRPSSIAQQIAATAPSGVGGVVLPSMAPPAATVQQQPQQITPQGISPVQSINPLPESPPMAPPPPPVVVPVVQQQQQQPPRQPPRQPRRQQQQRLQRVRAKPVPGHNFYNSHFIRALPNLSAHKRKQLLQAAIPQRKRIALNYYRDNNLPIPAMMHSPAPGFAPLVPGSPAVTPPPRAQAAAMSPDNDFMPPRPPPPAQPRLRRQPPPIPFPHIPDIDDDDVDDIDLLFRNRNRAQTRGTLREILDTYCASDKSQADMRIFNRDYLNSVSDICNNNI